MDDPYSLEELIAEINNTLPAEQPDQAWQELTNISSHIIGKLNREETTNFRLADKTTEPQKVGRIDNVPLGMIQTIFTIVGAVSSRIQSRQPVSWIEFGPVTQKITQVPALALHGSEVTLQGGVERFPDQLAKHLVQSLHGLSTGYYEPDGDGNINLTLPPAVAQWILTAGIEWIVRNNA